MDRGQNHLRWVFDPVAAAWCCRGYAARVMMRLSGGKQTPWDWMPAGREQDAWACCMDVQQLFSSYYAMQTLPHVRSLTTGEDRSSWAQSSQTPHLHRSLSAGPGDALYAPHRQHSFASFTRNLSLPCTMHKIVRTSVNRTISSLAQASIYTEAHMTRLNNLTRIRSSYAHLLMLGTKQTSRAPHCKIGP